MFEPGVAEPEFDVKYRPESDDDCILLEDTSNEFPKPMELQEMAGKTEGGVFLDIKMEPCCEIRENGSMQEPGPSVVESVPEPESVGLEVQGQVSPNKQMSVESQESFFSGQRDNSVQEPPEPQSEDRNGRGVVQ